MEKRDYAILTSFAVLAIAVGAVTTSKPLMGFLVGGTVEAATTAVGVSGEKSVSGSAVFGARHGTVSDTGDLRHAPAAFGTPREDLGAGLTVVVIVLLALFGTRLTRLRAGLCDL